MFRENWEVDIEESGVTVWFEINYEFKQIIRIERFINIYMLIFFKEEFIKRAEEPALDIGIGIEVERENNIFGGKFNAIAPVYIISKENGKRGRIIIPGIAFSSHWRRNNVPGGIVTFVLNEAEVKELSDINFQEEDVEEGIK